MKCGHRDSSLAPSPPAGGGHILAYVQILFFGVALKAAPATRGILLGCLNSLEEWCALNLKIYLFTSFRVRGPGQSFLSICDVACNLVAGKYMASIFDSCLWSPCALGGQNSSFVIGAVVLASYLLATRKVSSSM